MTTLKGVFPEPKPIRRKNFIHENVKSLRRMEQCFHTNKEVEELQKLQLHRHHKFAGKYQNVSARVNSSFREKKCEENDTETNLMTNNIQDDGQQLCRKSSAPTLNKNLKPIKKSLDLFTNDNAPIHQNRRECKSSNNHMQKLQGKVLSDPSFLHKHSKKKEKHIKTETTKFKSKGIQTLDTSDIDSLYLEGMIRYPSKKCLKDIEPINRHEMQQIDEVPSKARSPPSDRGDIEIPQSCRKSSSRSPDLHVTKEEVDFVKLNKERTSIASRMVAQLTQNTTAPPNYRKGVVPKYIRDRKEAYEKEQKAKAEAADSDCPEGHVPLPDSERKETLRMLKKNYQDYVNELNKMPIKTDTLKAQRRKIEIEKQLTKLEEGIKVFSRPKVYVKVNA